MMVLTSSPIENTVMRDSSALKKQPLVSMHKPHITTNLTTYPSFAILSSRQRPTPRWSPERYKRPDSGRKDHSSGKSLPGCSDLRCLELRRLCWFRSHSSDARDMRV